MPTRLFFRVWDGIRNLQEAKTIAKYFHSQGKVLEYKFTKSPDTKRYLGYGFVSFQDARHAHRMLEREFHTVEDAEDSNGRSMDVKVQRTAKDHEAMRRHQWTPPLYGFNGFFGGLTEANARLDQRRLARGMAKKAGKDTEIDEVAEMPVEGAANLTSKPIDVEIPEDLEGETPTLKETLDSQKETAYIDDQQRKKD